MENKEQTKTIKIGADNPMPIFNNGWKNFEKWRNQAETEKTVEKQNAPHLFQPGQSGNPNGRPKGAENFKTVFEKALRKVAETNKIDPGDLYAQIIAKGITLARNGDFRFYKDILDRIHGKAEEKLDMTSAGEKINMGNQIAFVNFKEKDDPKS